VRINNNARGLRVGDRVTTDFVHGEEHVVRIITNIVESDAHSSGLVVSVSDGGRCPTCGRPHGKVVNGVDGGWFIPEETGEDG